jgi:hypothetical protein
MVLTIRRNLPPTNAPLLGSGETTTREAAELAGTSMEAIRLWCVQHHIGRWDRRLRCYVVSRERLLVHLERRSRQRRSA